MSEPPEGFPRDLRAIERDVLEYVLPDDRPGYREYLERVRMMVVLAPGRRGPGDLVLGAKGVVPDISSPLAPVVAYGGVETGSGVYTVTVREFTGAQIDAEIVSQRGDEIPDQLSETRRWTYSRWRPGEPSPASGSRVRLIPVDDSHTLAVSREEKRLWIHDAGTGMNLLIPITNYYNQLMMHKGIRDPRVALHSGTFFADLDRYRDEELKQAFIAYNIVRPRVDLRVGERKQEESRLGKLFRALRTGKS